MPKPTVPPVQTKIEPISPTPPLTQSQFLPIYDKVIRHGSRNQPKIALTFDADMTPFMQKELQTGKVKSFYEEKIIDILEEQKIPATLFLTGLWAIEYQEVAKKLAQNPLFEIGNHSYSHPAFDRPCFNLPSIPQANKDREFSLSQATLKEIIGYEPKLFRFPGGCYQKSDLELAKKYGLTVIGWDVDSRDAFNSNGKIIMENVKKETKPGSILVFHLHDGKNAPKTAETLPFVIAYLKEKGFIFVKVGELLKDDNIKGNE